MMGRLYLNYKRHSYSLLGEVLKIKVDDAITSEVKKNAVYELELADGQHNVKMYTCGWTKDELVGYVEENIEISGDTFYTYQGPITIYGKGKLKKKVCRSADDFKKQVKTSNIVYKILNAALLIFLILYLLFPAGCALSDTEEKAPVKGNLTEWKGHFIPKGLALDIKNELETLAGSIKEEVINKHEGLTRVFAREDFAPEEIACENVLETYMDGRENSEVMELYAGEEIPDFFCYAEYDFDGDGVLDYVVLYRDSEEKNEKEDTCFGDIWIKEEKGCLRCPLPKAGYKIGGSWQEPELFMMVLQHRFYWDVKAIAVYQSFSGNELRVYGYVNSRYGFERIESVKKAFETEGMVLSQTIYQNIYGYDYAPAPVKFEIWRESEEQDLYQIHLTEQWNYRYWYADFNNIQIWDGNDDGYNDILYYIGSSGGSGGWWEYYCLFVWSVDEKKYIAMDLPGVVYIDFEAHKLYSCGQNGASDEYYFIYGLKSGKYQAEKELYVNYGNERREDGCFITTATYKEWGKIMEETDVASRDSLEVMEWLKKKYPEFRFWLEG